MFIEPTLDTGPILLQRKTEIGETETAPELMQRLSEIGAELLGETLAKLGDLTPRPQHDRDATFAPVLKKEDGLIDWSLDAAAIERRVRGFQPWPNAYTSFNSKGLTIWRAQPVSSPNAGASHGEVIAARGNELLVSCGEQTAVRLIEVQPESRKRMPVRDVISGLRVKVGDRFG
jgi:methionyl-tRNA formyltransferase